MFGSRRNIFSNVLGNFSEIWVIWIRKSHAFDSGKVGRYSMAVINDRQKEKLGAQAVKC